MSAEQPWQMGPTEAWWQAVMQQGEAIVGGDGPPAPAAQLGVSVRGVGGHDVFPAPLLGVTSGSRRGEESWGTLEAWHASGTSFSAPVIGCNKGGLLVRVCDGIGFVPASQLTELPDTLGTADLRGDLEAMVGQDLRLRLIELDRARNRVICSERATQLVDDDLEARLSALGRCEGCSVEGVVRSLCDFGVFVDLGGIDGLIHISELSWQRIGHPSEVLAINQVVPVVVLHVDRSTRRVALSYKRLQEDPWLLVGQRYAVGNVIDAHVTHVVHFGAFARVTEGVEGLIHISELSDTPFEHPSEVVSEGVAVRVRVLHIDADARRLGLSLRQAQ